MAEGGSDDGPEDGIEGGVGAANGCTSDFLDRGRETTLQIFLVLMQPNLGFMVCFIASHTDGAVSPVPDTRGLLRRVPGRGW